MIQRLAVRLAVAFGFAAGVPSPDLQAQAYEVIHDFGPLFGLEGSGPSGRLTLGPDGNFYGVTTFGGDATNCPLGCGTVFRMDSAGVVTTIHRFVGGEDGEFPIGVLLLASDGNFYGVTGSDGSLESCETLCGAVYRVDTDGNAVVIRHFNTADGFGPNAGLIEPEPGKLWGTTIGGGTPTCLEGTSCGTVYRMLFNGDLQTMHAFTFEEGRNPLGPLVLGDDGNLYGVTSISGSTTPNGVFRITLNGALTPIHEFTSACSRVRDGLLSVDGDLVGSCLTLTSSAIFRLTLDGDLQEIYPFAASGADGFGPRKPMQASDGLLYGVATTGGEHGNGTIWQLSLGGFFTKLRDFDVAGGSKPSDGLVQSPDGRFYGVAPVGGANDVGVLYRLTMPGLTHYYCPNSFVRRDQMAVFLLKIAHGHDFEPPACSGEFGDVTCPGLFADWIEQLADEGITAGCGGDDYCPFSPVTRAQMAVFLLKTKHGAAYTPPPCTGLFLDVDCLSNPFAAWIEQLSTDGITGGCGGDNFCPDAAVTRAQMAVFLLKIEHGGSYDPPSCQTQFADVACPSLYAAWIQQLYVEHITAGCTGP